MKISIALCTYNGACYLREQLDSIAAQCRPPDELIVRDDRSEDDTARVVAAFSRRAPFPVRFAINERNVGSVSNFGRTVASCAGDVIAFCDQDDVWREDKLAQVEAIFSAHPRVGAMISDAELVDERLNPLDRTLWEVIHFTRADQKRFVGERSVEALLKCLPPAHGMAMAFRAKFRTAILPFPPQFSHDTWTALIVALLSEIKFVGQPLVKYRQHGEQQVGIRSRRSRGRLFTDSEGGSVRAHLAEADMLIAASRRMKELGAAEGCARRLALLRSKAEHMLVRANIPRQRWRRVPVVLGEAAGLRYHRYSNGVLSLARDLLRGDES